jgi:hypothetical protein
MNVTMNMRYFMVLVVVVAIAAFTGNVTAPVLVI